MAPEGTGFPGASGLEFRAPGSELPLLAAHHRLLLLEGRVLRAAVGPGILAVQPQTASGAELGQQPSASSPLSGWAVMSFLHAHTASAVLCLDTKCLVGRGEAGR